MLTLGSAIRRLRRSRGLTQQELGRRLDVSPTYISHLEADRRDPSMSFVRALAREVKAPASLIVSVFLLSDLPKRSRQQLEPILTKLVEMADD
jgi:putative transcriptional regulator